MESSSPVIMPTGNKRMIMKSRMINHQHHHHHHHSQRHPNLKIKRNNSIQNIHEYKRNSNHKTNQNSISYYRERRKNLTGFFFDRKTLKRNSKNTNKNKEYLTLKQINNNCEQTKQTIETTSKLTNKNDDSNYEKKSFSFWHNGNDSSTSTSTSSISTCGEDCAVADARKNKQIENNVNEHNEEQNQQDKEDCEKVVEEEKEPLTIGHFTREVYNAICLRLGDTQYIPEDSVKALFNDMHLFPSDNQVTRMLQCARQVSRKNGTNHNYLTFGEFCFLVREMQNHQNLKNHKKSPPQTKMLSNNKCPNGKCEVFLGGSCNPTTWRADTAIPELQKHGISFYNPQVSIWAPELLAQEHDAKQSASVLLFVIDSQTRSTVGMLEVAYLVASGRCVIVVAQPYQKGQSIMGERITHKEYYDLVQGQKSLLDLIKTKGIQIHNNLSTALQCTAQILRNVSISGASPEDQVMYKLRRLREVYDSYNGQMHLSNIIEAYEKLTNRSLEISKLYNYLNSQNNSNITNNRSTTNNSLRNGCDNEINNKTKGDGGVLSFEKFCTLMAELSTDGCGMCNVEGRDYIRPLYWSCAFLKTRFMVRNVVFQSISNILAWAVQSFTRNQHTQCTNNQNYPQKYCSIDSLTTPNSMDNNREKLFDVYLGGSVQTDIKWREEIVVPLLKKYNISYYNPAIRDSNDTLTESTEFGDFIKWRQKINQSKIVLFVITNDTRSLTSMILAAHYIGSGKDVVLSIEQLNSENCVVANEMLTKNAIKDYNRARAYLKDLAERRQVPVCNNVEQAIDIILMKLSKNKIMDDDDIIFDQSEFHR